MINPNVVFEKEHVHGADFSGGPRFRSFTSVGSVFEDCRFDGIRPDACAFGAGTKDSVYRECSFDGADLFIGPGGYARFERCSFRDVRIRKWKCEATELIDCTFTGRIDEAIFYGTIPKHDRRFGKRETNEFHGNDFSGVQPLGADFRGGIDLTLQRLPQSPDDWRLDDAARVLAEVRRRSTAINDVAVRKEVQVILQVLEMNLETGQKDLYVNWKDFAKYSDDVGIPEFRALCAEAQAHLRAQP